MPGFLTDVRIFADQSADSTVRWIQVLPHTTIQHPAYGEVKITPERTLRFKQNFDKKVRGTDINTDYEHGLDPSKGTKASGWYKELEVREDGLWGAVEFTQTALDEIANGEWRYFSAEFRDEWVHPETQAKFQDVLTGGGLTNKPFIKGMPPINFSEVVEADPAGFLADVLEKKRDEIVDESKEWEHSEPGTLTPRKDGDGSDDKAIKTGSRRDSPPDLPNPTPEDSMTIEELLAELRKKMELPSDAPEDKVIKEVENVFSEIKPLRELEQSIEKKKQFAEEYPEEAKRMEENDKFRRDVTATRFSEKFEKRFTLVEGTGDDAKEKETKLGFSALVLEKIKEGAIKLSEGNFRTEDLDDILSSVAKGGVLEYGERGSSSAGENGSIDFKETDDPGMMFSQIVEKIMEEDKLDYKAALQVAMKKNPDAYKAYREHVPTTRD